jgi:sulfite exporter TauE/SafE
LDHLSRLAAICGHDLPLTGIVSALFIAGLVGSFSHCTLMCAPFILAQTAGHPEEAAGGRLSRLSRGLLLPYHLGRLTTYTLLGALLGSLGAGIVALTQWHWLFAGFLVLAALLFLGRSLALTAPRLAVASTLGGLLARCAGPLLRRAGKGRGYLLGVTLGFLPCGFLYAALAAAAGAGGAVNGGLAMAAFALATMPALFLLGAAGSGLTQRWRRFAERLAAPVYLANAALLTVMAVELMIAA